MVKSELEKLTDATLKQLAKNARVRAQKRDRLEKRVARLKIELAKAKKDFAALPKIVGYSWHGPMYEGD